MKAIIFLLSFMFVSCVIANTESRELSGVNPEPLNESAPIPEKPLMLADDYEECMEDCTTNGGSSKGCHCVCGWDVGGCNKIEVQNPIKLADYATCRDACGEDGGSDDECHDICR